MQFCRLVTASRRALQAFALVVPAPLCWAHPSFAPAACTPPTPHARPAFTPLPTHQRTSQRRERPRASCDASGRTTSLAARAAHVRFAGRQRAGGGAGASAAPAACRRRASPPPSRRHAAAAAASPHSSPTPARRLAPLQARALASQYAVLITAAAAVAAPVPAPPAAATAASSRGSGRGGTRPRVCPAGAGPVGWHRLAHGAAGDVERQPAVPGGHRGQCVVFSRGWLLLPQSCCCATAAVAAR